MVNQDKNVSIVIPVYNEENHIVQTLEEIENTMKKSEFTYEVVVVNDGSTDETEGVIKKSKPTINLITHLQNEGYGSAIKTGIRHSKYDVILITDADGTYPNKKIPELLEYLPQYDMVVGARIGKNVKVPILRRPAKWFLTKLANYLSETKILDLNSGLRAFKKNIALQYFHILPSSFSFTATITLAMISDGYSVRYVPVNYYKRKGKSKIHPLKDTINFISLILRTIIYFNPLKVFLPLSGILFLTAILVFLYSYFFTPKVMDISVIVILMGAIQVAVLGLLADLIEKRIKR